MADLRDYTVGQPEIKEMATGLKLAGPAPALPASTDLRAWCSPIENQLGLGSCTANAGMGVVEYFERRAFGKYIDGSRLFLYKTTRNLMGVTGDTGAWLRNVMGALVLCGVPAERYWPYTEKPGAEPDGFDREPPAFVYSIADNYEALRYFCHDPLRQRAPGHRALDGEAVCRCRCSFDFRVLGLPFVLLFGCQRRNSISVRRGKGHLGARDRGGGVR